MNFGTKDILKWGIPGWYLIINIVVAVSSLIGYGWITDNSFLAPSIIITLAGVPSGYVIYQPYFLLSTLLYENKGNQWNLLLLDQEDESKRNFLSYRYAYYLNNIHGYGSLLSSITISVTCLVVIGCINRFTTGIIILLTINILLAIIVCKNFQHYQKSFEEFVNDITKTLT